MQTTEVFVVFVSVYVNMLYYRQRDFKYEGKIEKKIAVYLSVYVNTLYNIQRINIYT